MSDLVKNDKTIFLSLIHGKKDLPEPFKNDILLFETTIAGTSHIENIEEKISPIKIGSRLSLFREIDNKYDPKAIEVFTEKNEKIGYIPRDVNLVFSRLLDGGKSLYLKVKNIEKISNWYRIIVEIYMED